MSPVKEIVILHTWIDTIQETIEIHGYHHSRVSQVVQNGFRNHPQGWNLHFRKGKQNNIYLGGYSPFLSTIVIFKHQLFSLGFLR